MWLFFLENLITPACVLDSSFNF